jgi:restriction system protein
MPVPDFQSLFVPLLRIISDGQAHKTSTLRDPIGQGLQLTEADLAERLASGRQTRFTNRLAWAVVHLAKAGAIERVQRGVIRITDRGRGLLHGNPGRLTMRELSLFPEYRTFRNLDGAEGENDRAPQSEPEVCADKTPEEKLAESYTILRDALSAELLDVIRKASPVFFEKLVVDLLVGMGYGGSVEDAGKAVGGAGDDGIDGIIKEDKLGLDVVYIQAKRWTANVGRPAVQSFVGSLEGHRARKGVLITTSDFSQDAREYVQRIDKKIVLVSGRQLTELMIDHNVGVTQERNYIIKRIDQDYFEEE